MVIKKTMLPDELRFFLMQSSILVPTYFSSNRGSLVARGVIVAEQWWKGSSRRTTVYIESLPNKCGSYIVSPLLYYQNNSLLNVLMGANYLKVAIKSTFFKNFMFIDFTNSLMTESMQYYLCHFFSIQILRESKNQKERTPTSHDNNNSTIVLQITLVRLHISYQQSAKIYICVCVVFKNY